MSKYIFDFLTFCDDYGVEYKNCNNSWVAIDCPIVSCKCRDKKGGFNLDSSTYNCFRCGRHSKIELIQAITNLGFEQSYKVLQTYSKGRVRKTSLEGFKTNAIKTQLPLFSKKIHEIPKAVDYLESRGYDIPELEDEYGIMATNHMSDIPHRIIIPIFFNANLVSWTARSYKKNIDKAYRYHSCDKDKEVINHKSILYNWDKTSDTIIVVEGATDCWRLGKSVVCTFGTQFCSEQIKLLKKKKKAYILYDQEVKAQKKAKKLMNSLSLFMDVENLLYDYKYDSGLNEGESKDPGDFSLSEVLEVREYCGI